MLHRATGGWCGGRCRSVRRTVATQFTFYHMGVLAALYIRVVRLGCATTRSRGSRGSWERAMRRFAALALPLPRDPSGGGRAVPFNGTGCPAKGLRRSRLRLWEVQPTCSAVLCLALPCHVNVLPTASLATCSISPPDATSS